MRTRILSAVVVLMAASAIAYAAQTAAPNLTGTWTGGFVIQGENPEDEKIHMVTKHTGADFTGTAGPNPDLQWAIAKGKVATTKDGTTVTFEVTSNGRVIQFDLKLVDGHLKGSAKAEQDGRKMNAAVDVQRAK